MHILLLHAPRVAPHQPGCRVPPYARVALGLWAGGCTLRAYVLRRRLRVAYGAFVSGYGGSVARRGGKDVVVRGVMVVARCGKEEGLGGNTNRIAGGSRGRNLNGWRTRGNGIMDTFGDF